jgi:hypothetical protein
MRIDELLGLSQKQAARGMLLGGSSLRTLRSRVHLMLIMLPQILFVRRGVLCRSFATREKLSECSPYDIMIMLYGVILILE